MRRWATGVVLGGAVVALSAAGCGSGSKSSAARTSTPATVTTTPPQTTTATGTIPPTNGASTAILPASFVLNADGSLTPPQVAAPAATTILLTVTSRAPHPVTVTLASHPLAVPPGRRASLRIAGLRNGRYAIAVDGRARATLVVGAQPGP